MMCSLVSSASLQNINLWFSWPFFHAGVCGVLNVAWLSFLCKFFYVSRYL